MRNIYLLLIFVLIFVAAPNAHASRKYDLQGVDNAVTKKGVIAVSASWLKDKGKKYDVNLVMQSDSEKPLLVMLYDLQCFRGHAKGELRHTFFNTGEKVIDFHPSQRKDFDVVCNLGHEAQGDFKIVVKKVFDNPNGDGKTTGKVIAKDIEWTLRAQ